MAILRSLVVAVVLLVGIAGCGLGKRGDAITGDFEGRDCGLFAVDGDWLVYSWSPPNNLSRPIHLVARRLSTGAETELEADWYGAALDLDGSTLVYARRPQGSTTTDLIAYDLASQRSTTLAQSPVISSPVVSGGMVAWATQDDAGGRFIATTSTSGGFITLIQDPGRPATASDTRPRLSGTNLVFLRRDLSTQSYTLMHHDMAANYTRALPISILKQVNCAISGKWVVYAKPGEQAIFAYNLVDQTETRIAETPRWQGGPVVRDGKVAWTSHVPKEEFKVIAGQPLIDERDFRGLYVLDIGSGKVKTLAENEFMLRRPRISSDGKVHVVLPRAVATSSAQIADVVRY